MSITRPFSVQWKHRLFFTRQVFHPDATLLPEIMPGTDGQPAKVLVIVDGGLLAADPSYPRQIETCFQTHARQIHLAGPIVDLPGGETAKNDRRVFDRLCAALHAARLCRRSYVLVVGGGAVLDVAGFAAAVVHRGVRLVRVPATTLAQADSGVGVKNGINAFGQKNFLGAFAPPWAVINDEALLEGLDDVAWRSGFAEAVKVALLKDPELFACIENDAPAIRQRDLARSIPILRRSALLHLEHIAGGDPFELNEARPLDFGHWSAHKLETLSRFSLSHGQAVAIGLALDMTYAAATGLADPGLARRLSGTLHRLGLPTTHPALREADLVLDGLEEFREHLGGRLTITMVRAPGQPVDLHESDRAAMRAAIAQRAEEEHATAGVPGSSGAEEVSPGQHEPLIR